MNGLFIRVSRPPGMAPTVDEQEVRAAAGLTMVIGAGAFVFAYFERQFLPLQIVTALFSVEFLVRVTLGLRYSPIGIVARAITLGRPPEWVSASPSGSHGRSGW
jgi:hypothetical protein